MRGIFHKKGLVLLVCISVFLVIGCESSMRTYLKEDAPMHKIKKLAVLTFDNMSKDKNASEKLANIFAIELITSGQFKVAEPGELERALKEVKIRSKGGLATLEIADAQKLGEALGVEAIIMGSIDAFEIGKKSDPIISLNVHMLDTKDGSLVWQMDYIATGSSFAYLLDFGKITSTEMLSRKMVSKLLAPIIKKSKNSLKEATIRISNAKQAMEKADIAAKDLKTKADGLEYQAKDAEERSQELELKVKQDEQEAIRINPDALARKINGLQEEIKAVENSLEALTTKSKKLVSAKISVESKIKEIETESKSFKEKLDEITGQINIFTAKERVARIRGNNEEADDYKKKADAAKVEAKNIQEKYDATQKTLASSKDELTAMAPEVKKAQDAEKVVNEKMDSLKAQLAVVEKMQRELPPDITDEQLRNARVKEEEVKKLKEEASKVKADSIKLREMAEQVKKQAAAAAETAEASKKLYDETRTKLE